MTTSVRSLRLHNIPVSLTVRILATMEFWGDLHTTPLWFDEILSVDVVWCMAALLKWISQPSQLWSQCACITLITLLLHHRYYPLLLCVCSWIFSFVELITKNGMSKVCVCMCVCVRVCVCANGACVYVCICVYMLIQNMLSHMLHHLLHHVCVSLSITEHGWIHMCASVYIHRITIWYKHGHRKSEEVD